MSDSIGIALIIASFFPGVLVILWCSKLQYDVGNEIVTGVIRGSPVSTKHRWLMLYQTWIGYVICIVACGVVVATVNAWIAANVTEADAETIAYMVAFLGAFAAIAWSLAGISKFVHFRSVLRQAEAD